MFAKNVINAIINICTMCFWKAKGNRNSACIEEEQGRCYKGDDIWAVSWRININLPGSEEENNVSGRWNWLFKGHRSTWLENGKPFTITEAREILKIFNNQQGMNANQSELTVILPLHASWISAQKQSQWMCLAQKE